MRLAKTRKEKKWKQIESNRINVFGNVIAMCDNKPNMNATHKLLWTMSSVFTVLNIEFFETNAFVQRTVRNAHILLLNGTKKGEKRWQM